MKQPQDYENRILLAIVGNSPAVVTETLYALTQTEEKPFFPTEINIITNAGNYQNIIDTLLGKNGKIHQFCNDYKVPEPFFTKHDIYQVISKEGITLEDVTTKEDNEIIANYITSKVRELTINNDTSLHVSIAGGRKTMTYYLGYAMSVFGRVQDLMSHVIIDDIYMSNEFFYPSLSEKIITSYNGNKFDASKVKVMLNYLPYLRLRDKLTENFLKDDSITFSKLIEASQAKLDPPSVKFKDNKLFFGGLEECVKLSNKELSLYLLILIHHKKQSGMVAINKLDKNKKELIDEFNSIYGRISGYSEHTSKYLHKGNDPLDQENITSTQSRINRKIKNVLGSSLAETYLIKSSGKQFKDILIYSFSEELKPDNIRVPAYL